ncbi:MAG TPA: DUF2007 domain-containing protein [Oligoflexia bacterium]|nr:DUF2007 domain-containing protein [Oligoflexia bacterium]HMR24832.1 DUF2007 domain-containing protein [Oligoflexia bacterium]
MPLKLVYNVSDLSEATLIVAYLKNYGIEAQSFDQHMNNLFPAGNILAPIRIVVNDYDYDQALKYIKRYQDQTTQA